MTSENNDYTSISFRTYLLLLSPKSNDLRSRVAQILLDEIVYEDFEETVRELIKGTCDAGRVGYSIWSTSTYSFYDEYRSDIEDICEKDIGLMRPILQVVSNFKNEIAFNAFISTVEKLYKEWYEVKG